MKSSIFILALLVFSACSTNSAKKSSNLEDKSKEWEINSEIIPDSLLAKIPLIPDSQFEIKAESDDNIEGKLLALNEKQIRYFYSSEEAIKYREYYSFLTFFYGKMPLKNGLLPILIINTDQSEAIYLDCFLINKDGTIVDMFHMAYIELSDYSLWGRGKFLNDSTYNLVQIAYTKLDNNPNLTVKDSAVTNICICYNGKIKKNICILSKDTIMTEE